MSAYWAVDLLGRGLVNESTFVEEPINFMPGCKPASSNSLPAHGQTTSKLAITMAMRQLHFGKG